MGKRKREKVEYEGKDALAARAVIAHVQGMLPSIRFTILTTHDEELIIELPFEVATKFLNQAIAAHSAIAPGLQVPRNHF